MLDTLPGEDAIIAKLKTIPGVDVFEGEYAPDSYEPVVDPETHLFKPYLTVKFNPGFSAGDNGIVSNADDTQRAAFSVFVITPDDRLTRHIRNQVRRVLLVDFEPEDASALRVASGYSFVDSDLGYNRYVQNVGFSYTFNLTPESVVI
jgi:hypothetical protein